LMMSNDNGDDSDNDGNVDDDSGVDETMLAMVMVVAITRRQ